MPNIKSSRSSGSTNRTLWKWITIFILFLTMLFIGSGLALSDNLLLLSGIALIPLIPPATFQFLSEEKELFNPLNFVFINFLIGSFLQTLAISFSQDHFSNLPISADTNFDDLLNGAIGLSIASTALVLGYALTASKTAHRSRVSYQQTSSKEWSKKRLITICLLFGGITLVSVAYYSIVFDVFSDLSKLSVKRSIDSTDNEGSLVTWSRFGMRFGQVACVALYAFHLTLKQEGKRRSGLEFLLLFMFLISIAGPILASSRSSLLFFLIALFATNNFVRGNWKFQQIRKTFIFVLLIILAMGTARYIQQRSVSVSSFQSEVGIAGSLTKLALSNNWIGVAKTSVLMSVVPTSEPYTNGSTYSLWILAPIPRAIWPDKPVIRIGGILGSQVFGTRDTNGIPPGFVGEAWLNFGFLGVPFVSFLLGMILRTYYNKFGKRATHSLKDTLLYSTTLTVVCFSWLASDFSGGITRFLQLLIPVVIILWYVTTPMYRKRKS